MKHLLLSAILCLFITGSLHAQNPNAAKNAFSAKVLFIDYGTLNDADDQSITNGIELSYIRNLTPWLNFAVPFKVGVIDVNDDVNNRTFASLDGVLQLQYAKSDSSRVVPYLMGGAGYTFEQEGNTNLQTPFGLGVNFRVGGRSFVNLQGEYRISQEENRDNLQLGLGYLHRFGKLDADNDGIADALDRCPYEAGTERTQGCPDRDMDGVADLDDECPARPGKKRLKGCPDSDDDGVADDVDDCPEVAGEKDLNGCPDSDNDGIADSEDDCPQVRGAASAMGCPDRDGDGVRDSEDNCPDKKGSKENNGCPFMDQDKDGIEDSKDECPTVAGSVKAKGCPDRDDDGFPDKADLCPDQYGVIAGCPDSDGDGVHDGIDSCPEQVGTAANKGCPELKKEEQEVLDFAMRAVQFETGKARLKPESNTVLDQIVDIMARYPAYSLSINGHTDSVGDAENNQILSQERAKACYQYLVAQGISPTRISYKGYGETRPIASNDSSSGRRQNRRVEFDLFIE
jgi:outer membrane protein OmpA-like peptidoglycan-associated protein